MHDLQPPQPWERKHVSFSDHVEIQWWLEDFPKHQVTVNLTHQALHHWPDKPWRLYHESHSFEDSEHDYMVFNSLCLQARETCFEFPIAGFCQADRPHLDTMPPWAQSIWNDVFVHQADVAAYREDGPDVTFLTWFLHDPHSRLCRQPRWLSFDIEYENWDAQLRNCWRDLLDHEAPFAVHLVHPEPPRDTGENHQGHLLIVQRDTDLGEAAILLTSQLLTHRTRLQRQAVFAGPRVNQDILLDILPT